MTTVGELAIILVPMSGAWLKRGLRRVWAAIADAKNGPPLVATCEVPFNYALPSDLDGAKTKGFLACQVVRDGDRVLLHSYWESEASRVAGWARFVRDAALSTPSASTGVVCDALVPRVPFVKRIKPQAMLLGIVAALGALSALRDYFGVLIEDAQVGAAFSQDEPLDVADSQVIEVPLRVLNRNRTAKLSVRKIDASLVPAAKGSALKESPLKVDMASFPALTPGQVGDTTVRGRAPPVAREASAPDEYDISTAFTLEAGLVRSPTRRPGPIRRVRVWPQAGQSSPKPRGRCASQCLFEGRLLVGVDRPEGLTLQAVLADAHTHAALNALEISGTHCRNEVEHGDDVSKATCTTGPLRAFQTYDYRLFVASPNGGNLSLDEWRRLKFDIAVLR